MTKANRPKLAFPGVYIPEQKPSNEPSRHRLQKYGRRKSLQEEEDYILSKRDYDDYRRNMGWKNTLCCRGLYYPLLLY